ncbi:hypothetical protein MesoLj131c_70350 (plasmid) [Mesorhizobium sp. 131-3-5]|nr:hypothetical protein MesoLj131c_70350 [Mesorhizobium sp. 131-3-5]
MGGAVPMFSRLSRKVRKTSVGMPVARTVKDPHDHGGLAVAWPAKLEIALAETASALVPMAIWRMETPTT